MAKAPPRPPPVFDARTRAAMARLAAACNFSHAETPLQWRVGIPAEAAAGWLVDLQPPIPCARDMSIADARLALAGRSIILVGDSLTMHTFNALVYALEFGSFAVPFGARLESDNRPGANDAGRHSFQLGRLTRDIIVKEPKTGRRNQTVYDKAWAQNSHWWGPKDGCTPGIRISYWSWRGKLELNGATSERSCLATAFEHRPINTCGAIMKKCAALLGGFSHVARDDCARPRASPARGAA